MKKRLAVILIFMVLLPLVAAGILAQKVAQDDSALYARQHQLLMMAQLQSFSLDLEKRIVELERGFERLCRLDGAEDADQRRKLLREKTEQSPYIGQFFIINKDGKLEYPVRNDEITVDEAAFLDRTQHLWQTRFPFRNHDEQRHGSGNRGFHTFFGSTGIHFIYWSGDASRQIVGFEIASAKLVSELIDTLPATPIRDSADHQIRLVSETGQVMYQYGGYVPAEDQRADAELALPDPLASWRLQYLNSPRIAKTALGQQTLVTLVVIGTLLTLAMLLLPYFLREYHRESRLAKEQVNFVNQVSHELKTPLTNIRMYAELLAEELDNEEEDRPKRYIQHITAESQRLSRLIQNVLSFAQSNRKKLTLRPSMGCVNDVIEECIAPFRPSLERLNVCIESKLDTPASIYFDADLVRQVLTNLIGNVEKYAAKGGWMRIESTTAGNQIRIRVADKGPGIAPRLSKKAFAPFARLHQSITEGATGTGIGLSISKELANLHGGDVTLLPSTQGAVFEFRFTPQRIPS